MNFDNYLELSDMLDENSMYDDFDRDEHKIFGLNENGNTYIDCVVNLIEAQVPDINKIGEKTLDKIVNKVIFPDNVKDNTVSSEKIKNVIESLIGEGEDIEMLYDDNDNIEVYDPDLDVEAEPVLEEEPGEALQSEIEDEISDTIEDEPYDPDLDVDDAEVGSDYEDLDDPIDTEEEEPYDPDLDVDDEDEEIEYEIDSDDDIDDIYDAELDGDF